MFCKKELKFECVAPLPICGSCHFRDVAGLYPNSQKLSPAAAVYRDACKNTAEWSGSHGEDQCCVGSAGAKDVKCMWDL